ncbi:MAG: hypothetical protein ACRCXN_13050 [Bacteroidales bacterium]
MEITIQGEYLDLSGNESVRITKQGNNPENLECQTDFSNTFVLPLTPRNDRILGYPSNSVTNPIAPYEFVPCDLTENGVRLFRNPRLRVVKVNRSNISQPTVECQLFAGTFDFFNKIGALTLQNLDMSAYNHEMFFGQTQQDNTYSNGYIYPLIDRGLDALSTEEGLYSLWTPAVYVLAILQQICNDTEIGLLFKNGLPTSPAPIDKLILPHTQGIRPCINDIAINHSGRVVSNFNADHLGNLLPDSQWLRFSNVFNGVPTDLKPPFNTPVITFILEPFDDGIFTAPNAVIGYKCLVDKLFARVSVSVALGSSGFDSIISTKLKHLDSDFVEIASYDFGGVLGNFDKFLRLNEGDELRVEIVGNIRFSPSQNNLSYFKVNIVDHEAVRIEQWEIAPNLAPVNQKEFLKGVLNFYGLYPYYNALTNTLELIEFDKILQFDDYLDFTQKVDYSKQSETFFEFGSFAQENYFSWKNIENQGVLFNPNNWAEKQKNYYTSPLSVIQENAFVGVTPPSPTLKLVSFEDTTPSESNPALKVYKEVKNTPTIAVLEDRLVGLDYTRRVYEINPSVITRSIVEDVHTCSSNGLDWQSVISEHFKAVSALLDKSRKEVIYFNLSLIDVLAIDFSKPIYLGEPFNRFYYLSKITEFYSPYKSVRCELYRIGNPPTFISDENENIIGSENLEIIGV